MDRSEDIRVRAGGPAWSRLEMAAVCALAAGVPAASWARLAPLDFTEACGFVTGGVCVWLVAKGSIWNWPVGIANNVFFAVLFWEARLYADMALQGVYLTLGIWGWSVWLGGGVGRGPAEITRATRAEWLAIGAFLVCGTWSMRWMLVASGGAAPLWDALTTSLSLSAQYLLCRKRLEHWLLWIAADLIYVPLYFSRALPLTAILYAGFIALCLAGWRGWNAEIRRRHG